MTEDSDLTDSTALNELTGSEAAPSEREEHLGRHVGTIIMHKSPDSVLCGGDLQSVTADRVASGANFQ